MKKLSAPTTVILGGDRICRMCGDLHFDTSAFCVKCEAFLGEQLKIQTLWIVLGR